jgi:hypothetical protein
MKKSDVLFNIKAILVDEVCQIISFCMHIYIYTYILTGLQYLVSRYQRRSI